MPLDDWLAAYEFREAHEILVRAPPARVFAALEAVTLREMPLAAGLLWLRALPARRARPRPRPSRDEPVLALGLRAGFVLLARAPERELVMGVVGRFWRPTGGLAPLTGARDFRDFRDFARPGFAKAAVGFRLEPEPGGVRLVTETRIHALDAGARRRFAAYWRLVGPASGLVRRLWLRAVRRRAERRA